MIMIRLSADALGFTVPTSNDGLVPAGCWGNMGIAIAATARTTKKRRFCRVILPQFSGPYIIRDNLDRSSLWMVSRPSIVYSIGTAQKFQKLNPTVQISPWVKT